MTVSKQTDGGWIAHDGGPCPIGRDVLIEVRVDDVILFPRMAWANAWERTRHYRIVEAQ